MSENIQPTIKKSVKSLFNINSPLKANAFANPTPYVPKIDNDYYFHPQTTQAILSGFEHNRRVLIQGLHGTGKSTHIQQVAARLNWPCVRINLDGNINRLDLVGKDTLKIKEGKQITEFQQGIIPWAMQQPMALIIDEYDAGRPEVLFIIQHLLEEEGRFMLLDRNEVIEPHPYFRIFATANTLGQGDSHDMYYGTNLLNHAQLDRWNVIVQLNYLSAEAEYQIVSSKVPMMQETEHQKTLQQMIELANMTRNGMRTRDLTTLMSPRTVINWAYNYSIFNDISTSFKLSFHNRVDDSERPIIAEYFQRIFNIELSND
jgi:cobaltochelatase CobS